MLKYFFVCAFALFAGQLSAGASPPTVLVSVAPHKFFVDQIAQGTVTVQLMVPAGSSAHTYEPTPKQMMSASRADIWFCVGENFEKRAGASLTSHRPNLELVDLRRGVSMITADPMTGSTCCCCHADGQDLHIWLSARQAKVQAKTIADTLSRRYPQHAALYSNSLTKFTQELDTLDKEIGVTLEPLKQRTILVSHPAYAYFCRDYGLKQLSIECEGRDPTPQQMTRILSEARTAGIKRIFIQPQYNSKGANLFGKELHAKVVMLDPYAEQYMMSMREIAQQFSQN